jgi:hypothetical protein
MKLVVRAGTVTAALLAALASTQARVPPVIFCWTPDVEFPIACDDEDSDDDEDAGVLLKRWAHRPTE